MGLLVASVDVKKAFDLVHREFMWRILLILEATGRVVNLVTGLYFTT